jgi:hypothetical protein
MPLPPSLCPTITWSPSFYPTVPYLLVSVLLCHYLPVYVILPCCLLVSLDVLLFHCLLCFCPTIHMSPSFYPTVPYLLVSVLLCHYLPVYVLLSHGMSIPAKLGWSTSFREDLNVTSLQTKLVIKMDPEK